MGPQPTGRNGALPPSARYAFPVATLWRLRESSTRRARAGFILAGALILFLVGLGWSFHEMKIDPSMLRWLPILFAVIFTVPSLWFNALELQLCARAAEARINITDAIGYSNIATWANLLPLPGSVLVRGGALVKNGASLARSGAVVVASGLLWLAIACGLSTAGIVWVRSSVEAAFMVGWIFLVPVCATVGWIWWLSDAMTALAFVAIRPVLLALMLGRLYWCFAAIGVSVGPVDVAVYSAASVLGSAAGIVPAGLGASEAIAAMLALFVGALPAAAFLSLGLSRVVGLACSGLAVLWFVHRPSARK